jgi:hypothetical protein
MALVAIPVSVLNKIRQLIYSFLWSGGSDKKHLHLSSWDSIARPKYLGGWGLRNIFLFSKALATNSLWRVLANDGIWHSVILGKYLPHCSVATWLRLATIRIDKCISDLEKSAKITAYYPTLVVLEARIWSFGPHGLDSILGMGTSAFLSQELLASLKQHNIYFLFQAKGTLHPGTLFTQWKGSTELGLTGNMAAEWDRYCRALLGAGIQLQDHVDELQWIGGDKSGVITVKNIYEALATKIWKQNCTGWRRNIWKWNIAQKIKLFIWLAAENKILTWDNLQNRGWEGPNICHLCQKDSETVTHLLVKCVFTQQIWSRIIKELKLRTKWEGNSMRNCFEYWAKKETKYSHLPCLVSWHIWLERNKTIFEHGSPSTNTVCYKILGGLECAKMQKEPTQRSIKPTIQNGRTTGWFDGAAQNNGQQSGAGGLIRTDEHTIYKWTFNCGAGTNTRA